ncbi:transcriptional-regulating factor 1-like isoform X1 [Saccostrea cucullata]|uniref:transcriptional-regulating factor 1-like isoform X1 n=2 Tax=Saccostrea cuccullata TaxID=36930 RepID=UPI002ED19840
MNPHHHVSTSNLFMPEKGISSHQGGNSAINYPHPSILGGYSLTDSQFHIRLPLKEDMGEPKHDNAKVDLYSMAEDKSGLGVMNSFPDSGDQTSPITPVPRSTPHIHPFRPSANSGDAMLSAINYNENEILQDGPFDVSVAGTLPNLDDGMILPNMGTQDLFDGEGNMDEPYDMEEAFGDPSPGLVGEGNLGSVIDPEGLSIDPRLAEGVGKKKMKGKQMKTPPQGSPGRNSNLLMCTTCNKSFNNTSALAKHRLTHSDERKYVCNLCQKAFKRQDHLNGHLMTHREKKPYECTVENCQKSYCDARSLRRHLENHHNQSPEQIQEAIAKVAQNAAAVIAAAAASNTASIKASVTSTQTSPGSCSASSAISSTSVGNQSIHSDVTLPAIEGGGYSSQYASESSTPVTSPTYGVPHAPQTAFQYEQQQPQGGGQGGQQGGMGELEQQVQVSQQQAVQEWQLKLQQEQEQQAAQALKELQLMKLQQQQQQFSQQPMSSESAMFGILESQQQHADQQAVHDLQLKIQQQQQAAQQAQIQQQQQVSLASQLQQTQQAQLLQSSQMQQAQELQHQLQMQQQLQEVMDSQGLQPSVGFPGQNWQAPSLNPGVKQEPMPQSTGEEQPSNYLGQVSPISPAPGQINAARLINPLSGVLPRGFQPNGNDQKLMDESKPVVCNICDRKFKNIQALNGHMRLHGGYFKKEVKEDKKTKKMNPMMAPPSPVGQKPGLPGQPFQGGMDQVGSSPNQHNQMQYTLQSPVPPDSPMSDTPTMYKTAPPTQPQFWDQLSEQQIQQLLQQEQQQMQSGLERQQKQPIPHPILQRQGSMETNEYSYDNVQPPVTQMHAQNAPHQAVSAMETQEYSSNLAAQVQQLVQQQIQQQQEQQQRTVDNFSSPLRNSHINLNSLPDPMNPLNVQTSSSSLQPKFAQSQYGSQRVKQEGGGGMKEAPLGEPLSQLASSHVTLVSTSKHQGMTVAQLLNSMETPEGLKQFELVEPAESTGSRNINSGKASSSQTVPRSVASSHPSSVYPEMGHSNPSDLGKVMDINSALDDINSTIAEHEMRDRRKSQEEGKEVKAAEIYPFSFPKVTITDTGRDKSEVKELHKVEKGDKHKELKRRLSGSDYEKPKISVNFATQKFPTKDESFVKPSPSICSPETKQRMRSKSGDDFKLLRSQSVDNTFMRPRSRTEASLHKFKSHDGNWDSSKLSKSDGAGQFRNPNSLGTLKMRRKHRPSPLFIPTYLNNSGFQSRLRSPRILPGESRGGNTPPPYTPPPMLSPIRSGSGLFCSLSGYIPITPKSAPLTPRNSLLLSARSISSLKSDIGDIQEEEEPQPEAAVEPPPETDVLPHVNIGSQYQAEIPPFNENRSEAMNTESREEMVWTPSSMADNSEEDVQYYQEFSCSAGVPGNGCNVEYALHLLHILKGDIKEAMLKLMEGKISLPKKNTLLDYKYQETDQWSSEEIEKYQQALWKCDKDFFKISKEIGTKTTKECLHFYYLWKKVCPDEHKRLRIIRRKREHDRLYNLRSQQAAVQAQTQQATAAENPSFPKPEENDLVESDSESIESMDTDNQPDKDDARSVSSSVSASPVPTYTCDYPDCFASFTSKQGLNGHIRIHGGGLTTKNAAGDSGGSQEARGVSQEARGPGRPSTKTSKPPKPSPVNDGDQPTEVFPCKLCGRVFHKVKSRSAHMKSHRMAENEKNKVKQNNNVDISLNSIQGSPFR